MSAWGMWFLVAILGALGAIGRYGLSVLVTTTLSRPRLGVIAANLIGAALAGALLSLNHPVAGLLAIGFAGSLTTFSTIVTWMAADTTNQRGGAAFCLLLLHIFLGIAAAWAGFALGGVLGGIGLG